MSSLNPQHAQRSIWSASQTVSLHQQQAQNGNNSINLEPSRICFADNQEYSAEDQSREKYVNINNHLVNELIVYPFKGEKEI